MDQDSVVEQEGVEATPIFNAYRRGYDPEQVDRYVADQQRRLDETTLRATEAERKLAAAVGQLRELHRRVATLESEERTSQAQAPTLDALGERVQRILQEAWEGAYSLRQNAEREVAEFREEAMREVTSMRETAVREAAAERETAHREVAAERETAQREVAEMIDAAERRVALMREETERRRQAYLERVEQDREEAVNQITYLYDQRQSALAELTRLQTTIETTVEEMARSPLGVPSIVSRASRRGARQAREDSIASGEAPDEAQPVPEPGVVRVPGLERPISVYGSPDTGLPISGFHPPTGELPVVEAAPVAEEPAPPVASGETGTGTADGMGTATGSGSSPGIGTVPATAPGPVAEASGGWVGDDTSAVRITGRADTPFNYRRAQEARRQGAPRPPAHRKGVFDFESQ